jgi:hypothetical protein
MTEWTWKAKREIHDSEELRTRETWEEVTEMQNGLACKPELSNLRTRDPFGDKYPEQDYLGPSRSILILS